MVIILVNRSWTRSVLAMLHVPNATFRWVLLATCSLLAVVLGVPAARDLFHFAPLHRGDLVLQAWRRDVLCPVVAFDEAVQTDDAGGPAMNLINHAIPASPVRNEERRSRSSAPLQGVATTEARRRYAEVSLSKRTSSVHNIRKRP